MRRTIHEVSSPESGGRRRRRLAPPDEELPPEQLARCVVCLQNKTTRLWHRREAAVQFLLRVKEAFRALPSPAGENDV